MSPVVRPKPAQPDLKTLESGHRLPVSPPTSLARAVCRSIVHHRGRTDTLCPDVDFARARHDRRAPADPPLLPGRGSRRSGLDRGARGYHDGVLLAVLLIIALLLVWPAIAVSKLLFVLIALLLIAAFFAPRW